MNLTEAEIEAAKTPNGGWTKETLAGWGVSWPPPRGWKSTLIKERESDDDYRTRLIGVASPDRHYAINIASGRDLDLWGQRYRLPRKSA